MLGTLRHRITGRSQRIVDLRDIAPDLPHPLQRGALDGLAVVTGGALALKPLINGGLPVGGADPANPQKPKKQLPHRTCRNLPLCVPLAPDIQQIERCSQIQFVTRLSRVSFPYCPLGDADRRWTPPRPDCYKVATQVAVKGIRRSMRHRSDYGRCYNLPAQSVRLPNDGGCFDGN